MNIKRGKDAVRIKHIKVGALALIGIMVCSVGCQMTPKEDIVVNKNEAKQLQTASDKESALSNQFSGENIPERYKDSFQCLNDDVKVTVNAGISVLSNNGEVSTIRVRPHQITENEVKKWADVLFEGQIAYEPKTQYTKSELEEKILMLKKANDKDTLMEEYGSEAAAETMQAEYNEAIAYYESIYNSTPNEIEKKECDWSFHSRDYYDLDAALWNDSDEYASIKKTEKIAAVCVDSDGLERTILANRRSEEDYIINDIAYAVNSDSQIIDAEKIKKINKEDAEKLSSDVLDKLDLSNWTLWDSYVVSDDNGLLYHFNYSPTYNDVPALMGDKDVELNSEDTYAANYNYSSLMVNILNGRVDSIYLTAPIDQVEVVDEKVTTLSFEKVYASFKNQMQNKYTVNSFIQFGGEDAKEEHQIEIKVNSIKEGLFRIKEKNTDYSYLLVPTWIFIGDVIIDENNMGDSTLCYVNALDGSIIDPKLGY